MFEQAVRNKLRFTYKGQLSVEDLWDLSQTQLDEIYLPLKAQLNQAEQGSLLGDKPKSVEEVKNKIDILKYIATVKKEESDKRVLAAERKRQKAKLLELMEKKQNSELEGKSTAEIQALIDALDS